MSKNISLKAKVTSRTVLDDGQVTVYIGPDYEDGKNETWAKYTPSLSWSMTLKDEQTAEPFVVGQCFDVTMVSAD